MFNFALKNMAVKKAKILMIVLSIVISASVALLAYNISCQVDDGFKTTAGYYDMIIGPSGSATQLAMNTMFFTETPLGTISYAHVEALESDTRVNRVVPFTMGDSYNGTKIVGTSPDFLDGKVLSGGTMFEHPFEAVIGASVAKKHGLSVGATLVTSHGIAEGGASHESTPLTVVGILQETKTAYDNVIFTAVETVWQTHGGGTHDGGLHVDESHTDMPHTDEDDHGEHAHGEVCAILVKTKSFNHYSQLKNEYSSDASLLVINPSEVLREVMENVDLSAKIVYVLCVIILAMNIFIISIITLLNLYDSKKEIALMRLIGISMRRINLLYLIQNALIGLTATAFSLAASRLCLLLMGEYVASMGIVLNAAQIYPFEWIIMAVVFLISVLPTVVATFHMSRKDEITES